MGSFTGHILPGFGFLSFAICYAFHFSWKVLSGQRIQYQEKQRLPGLRGALRHSPLVGVMKILFCTVAVMGEFFFPPGVNNFELYRLSDPKFRFLHRDEWQHITMYTFFAFSGWVDIISQVCLPKRLIQLEQVAVTAALYVTTLLLKFHTEGKNVVQNQVHSLLLITCSFTCLILTVEIWKPNDRLLWFTKTFFVMQQGTWLLHIAFILYRPPSGQPWDSSDMANLMFLVTFYCWHLILNAVLLAAIFGLTKILFRVKPNWFSEVRVHGEVSKGLYQLAMNGVVKHQEEEENLTGVDEEQFL